MDVRFDGKTALVTGGSRGIGYACVEMLLDSGARVAFVGVDGPEAAAAEKRLAGKGEARGFHFDVANLDDACDRNALAQHLVDKHDEYDAEHAAKDAAATAEVQAPLRQLVADAEAHLPHDTYEEVSERSHVHYYIEGAATLH